MRARIFCTAMGNIMGTATTSASKLTSTPNAEKAVQAAKKAAAAAAAAKFPGMPSVPTGSSSSLRPPPQAYDMEREANRGIVDMLNKSNILTQNAPTTDASRNDQIIGAEAEEAHGLKVEELMAALVLHARAPERWTPSKLAQKYGLVDEAALASALTHVKPYRVVEEDDKVIAVAVAPAGLDEDDSDAEILAEANQTMFERAKQGGIDELKAVFRP